MAEEPPREQKGILYAHASMWSVEVTQSCHRGPAECLRLLLASAACFLELNDVYWRDVSFGP